MARQRLPSGPRDAIPEPKDCQYPLSGGGVRDHPRPKLSWMERRSTRPSILSTETEGHRFESCRARWINRPHSALASGLSADYGLAASCGERAFTTPVACPDHRTTITWMRWWLPNR